MQSRLRLETIMLLLTAEQVTLHIAQSTQTVTINTQNGNSIN